VVFPVDPALASRALRVPSATRRESVAVEGVWLRRVGDEVQVLVEVDGSWRMLMSEPVDGNFSHVVEPHGIVAAPYDRLTR